MEVEGYQVMDNHLSHIMCIIGFISMVWPSRSRGKGCRKIRAINLIRIRSLWERGETNGDLFQEDHKKVHMNLLNIKITHHHKIYKYPRHSRRCQGKNPMLWGSDQLQCRIPGLLKIMEGSNSTQLTKITVTDPTPREIQTAVGVITAISFMSEVWEEKKSLK